MLYTFKIILRYKEAFNSFLVEVAKELVEIPNNEINNRWTGIDSNKIIEDKMDV